MNPNKCVICGNPCKKKTCGEECRRLLQNQQHAARKRAKRAAASAKRARTMVCKFCGKEYVDASGKNRRSCGDEDCQIALRKEYDIERYGRVKLEFDCPVCGKHVSTYRRSQTTCGSASCYGQKYGCANEQELKERRRAREKEKALAENGMPCPWATHKLDYLPPGVTTWDCAEMDPLSCGTAKVILEMETEEARRNAA